MLSTCCFYFSEDEAEIKSLWEDLFIYLFFGLFIYLFIFVYLFIYYVSNIVELIMK